MKILYIGDFGGSNKHSTFFDKEAKENDIEVTTLGINANNNKKKLIAALTTSISKNEYDIIVSTEYFISFAINIKLMLTKNKTKHIIYGLNQSARLIKSRYNIINNIINSVFNNSSLFVTHSKEEIKLFSKIHNLDGNKFSFSHWGFDLPVLKNDRFSNENNEYIAFIGRNNRDLRTFCDALAGSKYSGIIITAAYNKPSFPLPENINIFYDLPMDDCLSCIKHSKLNVVLVNDANRGAGHITIVASMLMKKPQIISDVKVIDDYFIDGRHGIKVPLNNAKLVKDAIKKLEQEPLYTEVSENAYLYAIQHFKNDKVANRFIDILKQVNRN